MWGRGREVRALRVATWNIAGGHRSAQAPESFTREDQRAALQGEVQRWIRVYGCDVLALQECESAVGDAEVLASHELVGAVEAGETRGWVHLYVRRGARYERIEVEQGLPCVAMRMVVEAGGADEESLVVAAVHLPVGDCAGRRQRILE